MQSRMAADGPDGSDPDLSAQSSKTTEDGQNEGGQASATGLNKLLIPGLIGFGIYKALS